MKTLEKYRKALENHLKKQCDKLTKRQQITTLVVMMSLFAGLALYVFGSAIYNIGINEKQQQRIQTPATLQNLNTNNHERK